MGGLSTRFSPSGKAVGLAYSGNPLETGGATSGGAVLRASRGAGASGQAVGFPLSAETRSRAAASILCCLSFYGLFCIQPELRPAEHSVLDGVAKIQAGRANGGKRGMPATARTGFPPGKGARLISGPFDASGNFRWRGLLESSRVVAPAGWLRHRVVPASVPMPLPAFRTLLRRLGGNGQPHVSAEVASPRFGPAQAHVVVREVFTAVKFSQLHHVSRADASTEDK